MAYPATTLGARCVIHFAAWHKLSALMFVAVGVLLAAMPDMTLHP